MARRFVSIWFRHLSTDWFTVQQPFLKNSPFVLRAPSHGRMMIVAANAMAEAKGIYAGTVLADARAVIPDLQVLDDKSDLIDKLLKRLAEWSIRFTPVVAVQPPDGLLLDATGCTHLWGGEQQYMRCIEQKLKARGYDVRIALAGTPGVAWGMARFGKQLLAVEGYDYDQLMHLPPEALQLEPENAERLHKLGLHQIHQFIKMPRASLRRRFGPHFISQLDKALGLEMETIEPVIPIEPYQERLPCLEPIVTATGIEIALKELLTKVCLRLQQEQKGLRSAILKSYRVDGKVEKIEISTHRPSHHVDHLFKLFELKIATIEPALGIELFVLEAPKVEDHFSRQEKMWEGGAGLEDESLGELIDRIANKTGASSIHRYLPAEHYWPERSFKQSITFHEKPSTAWRGDKPRPLQLLATPEPIHVTTPIPDYPPLLFIHKGKRHTIKKADGPERIEQEWWLQEGQHRDYYYVEDEDGQRFWLFRLGHYHDKIFQWFLHGFFS